MRAFAAFLIVATATAIALAVLATTAGPPPSAAPVAIPPRHPDPPPSRVNPGAVLDRMPYLGVACGRASSTRCDRVGLAVWTRRDLDTLRGSVRGRRIAMSYVGAGGSAGMFVGYLQPAGLRDLGLPPHWEGARRPSLRVRIWATKGSRTTTTTLRVPLRAGWG